MNWILSDCATLGWVRRVEGELLNLYMAGVKLDNSLHKNGIKVYLLIEKLELNLIERIFYLVCKKKFLAGVEERQLVV